MISAERSTKNIQESNSILDLGSEQHKGFWETFTMDARGVRLQQPLHDWEKNIPDLFLDTDGFSSGKTSHM